MNDSGGEEKDGEEMFPSDNIAAMTLETLGQRPVVPVPGFPLARSLALGSGPNGS